jgi:exosortase sorting signal-containing protein
MGDPEGNFEIYPARCCEQATARNTPTLSEWGFIILAGAIGVFGVFFKEKRDSFGLR